MSKVYKLITVLSCLFFIALFTPVSTINAQTCTDVDGDGYGLNGDASCTNAGVDCNDNDLLINPGAVEGPFGDGTCSDGADNNCDGNTDGADINCSDPDVDDDGDTYTENDGDCNDGNFTVYPGAPLKCDALDNNCDGYKDYLTDEDKDGDGEPWCAGDCDDNNPNRSHNILEGPFGDPKCSDFIDNDCDNRIDAADSQCEDACTDADSDGYGNPGHGSCPSGTATDCNDNNAAVNPGASDANCNGVDNNCSGTADDEYVPPVTNCGIGECASTGLDECQNGTTVDTCTPGIPLPECPFPGHPSNDDGLDNNCDGNTDDCPIPGPCWDVDGDGYGYAGDVTCTNPGADCVDTDPAINPGASDANCDTVDDNCSGTADDQYVPTGTTCGTGACFTSGQIECQSGAEVDTCAPLAEGTEGPFPGPTCSDGIDNDCDGLTDTADVANCSSLDSDDDGDGYTENQGDCNDTTNTVYPGAPLLCDGLDNNCDGYKDFLTDEDKDGDGVVWCAGDCNDNDPLRYPGNQEGPTGDATCSDGIDNDCDNKVDGVDGGCQDICTDEDGDGYGSPGHSSCANGIATDCNDNNAAINPGATDTTCDGLDNNCSGTADDGYVVTPTNCGEGECVSSGQLECQSGVEIDTCTPGAPVPESPVGSPECGDGLDNDCDGLTDVGDPGCAPCTDNDGDGYGSNGDITCANGTEIDCNDNDAAINPGGDDANCNGIDEDCVSGADSGYVVTPTNCGTGACTNSGQVECQSGVEVDTCAPLAAGTEGPYPGPTCSDGVDNDCDGLTDGVDIADCSSLDVDDDGDGLSENQGDCDDTHNTVYPNAPLICDGLDNNCDGFKDFLTDEDKDGDGVVWCAGDCNDNDPNRFPGNVEGPFGTPTCSDGIDNNCDNKIDAADPGCVNNCIDNDGDLYGAFGNGACTNAGVDCNDNDPAINPAGTDTVCDGIDGNCSGTADDQYVPSPTNCGVGECVAAGQLECQGGVPTDTCIPGTPVAESPIGSPECGDGLDNDCDGFTDAADTGCAACTDNDGDGYGSNGDVTCANGTAIDCNDNDVTINPGSSDTNCDTVDDNCSGTPDDEYVTTPTSCGVGECASSGQIECQTGVEVDTCVIGTPVPENTPNIGVCIDGLDNDCDGLIDQVTGIADPDCSSLDSDDDGDGLTENQGDCDDTDPLVFPGAPIICDGKDSNCDGNKDFLTDEDKDADGVPWCAGDCNDNDPNRYPGNQEGPRNDATCSDGIDNDCDNKIDAADPACAPPTCDTKFNPLDGPHIFDLLDPVDDSVIATSCSWCHTDTLLGSGTTEQRIDCQRCHADPADTSDPLNGVLKDPTDPNAFTDNPPYGFGSAPNVKMHSSTVLGTKYSNWNMDCVTCHNPHLQEQDAANGTTYGKLVKEFICFDNTAIGGGIFEEIVEFTAATGPGSFADGAPYNENICEMCHTQTNHHRNDGLAPGDWDGVPGSSNYLGHNDGGPSPCTDCHAHNEGFKASGSPVAPHDTGRFLTECDLCHISQTDFTSPVPDIKCEQCHTTAGVEKVNFPTAPDVLTHSDVNNPGSAYTYTNNCVDCHDPMFGSTNLNLIKTSIASSVLGGTIDFTAYSLTGSFADGPPYPDNICNTCHSQTNHHQADGVIDLPNTGSQDHNNSVDCRTCHAHDNAFIPDIAVAQPHDTVTDCTLCHVSANYADPVPNTACETCHTPTGVNKGSYPLAPDVMTHQSRNCIECHDPMFGSSNLDLVRTSIAGSIVPGSTISFIAYNGIDSFGNGAPYNENICDTCHSATNHHQSDGDAPGGQQHENGSDCRSCHDHNDAAGAWAAPNIMAASPHNVITDCNLCHINGRFSDPVPNSQCANCHTPSGSAKVSYPTAPDVLTHMGGTCVECHDPMNDQTNINHVRSIIAGSIVPGSNIVFTTRTLTGSFADGPPYNENVCDTCHSATNHHQSDGVAPGGQDHENGSDCTTCHDHNGPVNAFAAPVIPVSAPHDAITDCYACHMGYFADPIPNSQCEQCHTLTGALKGSYPTAPDVLTHQSGTCVECHDPMNDQTNINHVRSTIAGSITPGSNIVFTTRTLSGSFADGPPYNENVCNTCHSATNHHQSDGVAPGGQDHENGSDCTSCHDHNGPVNAFAAPNILADAPHDVITDCTLCHTGPSFSDAIPDSACDNCHTPTGSAKSSYPTAPNVTTHAGSAHGPFSRNCVDCHNPMDPQANQQHIRTDMVLAGGANNVVFPPYVVTAAPWNGVCENCHTMTNHHQNDGTAPGGQSHNDAAVCTSCHPHLDGFLPTAADVPPPHDVFTDCTVCHVGPSDFTTPIPDSKCQACHDPSAPGSGSLNQLDDFTGLTTGDAGRPIFGNWTGLPGDDTTNGWMVWNGATNTTGTGPSDGNPSEHVILESSSSSGGLTVDTMGFGTAGNAASNSSTSNRYVDRTNPATADATITSISANMNSTGNITFYTISSISPSCTNSCSGTVTDIVTVNASSTGVNTWNGLSLAVNNGDHLGFVSTSATVRRSSSGTFVRYIYSQGNSVSISENITDFQYSSTNNHGLQIEATYEYGTCTGECDPANGADVTAGSEQYLESNVLDANNYAFNVTFDWNMNVGDNTDASLHLDAWNGTAWDLDVTGAAINNGNSGDVWTTEGPIDLSAYTNSDLKLRIRYLVGNGTIELNDVAVDNLTISGAGAGGGSDKKVMTHGDTTNPPRPYIYSNACVDCHNPMFVQPNLAFIRPTIAKSVLGGTIDFTQYTGTGSFADGPPYPDNICNTCHSLTQHHQADGSTPGGQDHNNGADCALCHPHQEGFQPQGGCTVCHSQSPPIGSLDTDRRQIVEGTPGDGQGDFVKTSHHVTDGTTTEIVTDDECVVCHDQSSHQSFGDGQTVLLNDQDGGTSFTYDGTGASIEGFCVSCHDTDGSLLYGSQPFIASGDTNSPPDVGWSAGVVSHSSFDVCFNCHTQGHGSDFEKILVEDNEPGLCFNCHDADGPASTDISSKFAQPFGHPVTAANSSIHCLDCHNPHQAEPGTHTPDGQWYPSSPDANTNLVSGVLSGVMGVEPSPWAPAWTKTDSYTVLDSAEKEYQICFKCHARYSHQYSQDCLMCHPMTWDPELGAIIAGFKFRSAQREFNINNKSAHSVVVTSNNQSGSYAPKALSTSQMEAPWTNMGNQTMYCSDCHGAENEDGGDPRGPHGSDKPFMLKGPNTMWPAGSVRLFSLNDVSGDSSTESRNTNWRNELFCLNCHDSFPSSNRNTWQNEAHIEHDDRDYEPAGGNKRNVYCIACHAIVPHGSHVSRLITYRTELPEYNTYNDVNYNVIEGFRKTSRFNYSEDDCRTVTNLGCDKHDDKVNTWD